MQTTTRPPRIATSATTSGARRVAWVAVAAALLGSGAPAFAQDGRVFIDINGGTPGDVPRAVETPAAARFTTTQPSATIPRARAARRAL